MDSTKIIHNMDEVSTVIVILRTPWEKREKKREVSIWKSNEIERRNHRGKEEEFSLTYSKNHPYRG